MSKDQLKIRGWTPEKLRQRMAGCRAGIKEAKITNGPAVWTYRFLFVSLYLGYKRNLFELLK